MLGQFFLTGGVAQVIKDSADAGFEQDDVAFAGWSAKLISNWPVNIPVADESTVRYIDQRIITLLEDGSISEDGVNPGIYLTAHDPVHFDQQLQWTIKPDPVVFASGKRIRPLPWTFNAPLAGETKSLGELTAVVPTDMVVTARGPRGYGLTGDYLGSPADQTAMIALTGDEGDWVIRVDTKTIWVLIALPASSAVNWVELDYPLVSADVLSALVVAAIAGDSVAVAAAVAAVAAAVAAADLISGDDPRLPEEGDDDTFRVIDRGHYVAFSVGPEGQLTVGATEVIPDRNWENGFRIVDEVDYLAFEVRDNGEVFAARFSDDTNVGTVHIVIMGGQSNGAGYTTPTNAEIDPPNPRIFQMGADAEQIGVATVPLDTPLAFPSGISPITFLARSWLQRAASNDVVVIVPAAKGSSQVSTATAENANGIWNVAYTGASPDLWRMLKLHVDRTLISVRRKWPGATANMVGMFWHQGEANMFGTNATYSGWFDAMVADLRTHLSDPDLPVVLGGLVPEYLPDELVPRGSHIDTPNRVLRTGFAYGVSNGGRYGANAPHYSRQGSAELARRMLTAYDRALLNTVDSEPLPPSSVSGKIVDGVLTVEWPQPMCRYTGFVPEYSYDNVNYIAITHSDVSNTATVSGIAWPVWVRVATVNEVGTSATTTPVYTEVGPIQAVPATSLNNFITWTHDVSTVLSSTALTAAGIEHFIRMPLYKPSVFHKLWIDLTAFGSSLANCYLVLHKSNGTVVGQTADLSTAFTTGGGSVLGYQGFSLSAPTSLITPVGSDDFVYGAIVAGSGSVPSFGRTAASAGGQLNLNTAVPELRYGVKTIGNVATVPNVDLSTLTVGSIGWWMAAS